MAYGETFQNPLFVGDVDGAPVGERRNDEIKELDETSFGARTGGRCLSFFAHLDVPAS
jgi:hypothetical protein